MHLAIVISEGERIIVYMNNKKADKKTTRTTDIRNRISGVATRTTDIRNRISGVDFVSSLDDDAVCDMINFDFNIKMYDVDQAIRNRNITLATCRPFDGIHYCTNTNRCKGHWHMPQMRDLLISLITKRI